MATYLTYSDPSHGWMKVPRSKLKEYGIENDISIFSYQKGNYVYLEEDGDLTKFMNAANENGEHVKMRHYSGNRSSRIRSYDSYKPQSD